MNGLDSQGLCVVKWVTEEDQVSWRCTRQLDSFKHPERARKCFLRQCPGVSLEGFPEEMGHIRDCKHCRAPFRSTNSHKLHCSGECRKNFARSAYRKRQRLAS